MCALSIHLWECLAVVVAASAATSAAASVAVVVVVAALVMIAAVMVLQSNRHLWRQWGPAEFCKGQKSCDSELCC